jgi:hypothetical protein
VTNRQERTHLFIIRVWWERREALDAEPLWRGYIEHVTSGNQRYFTNLGDAFVFIRSYLDLSSNFNDEI